MNSGASLPIRRGVGNRSTVLAVCAAILLPSCSTVTTSPSQTPGQRGGLGGAGVAGSYDPCTDQRARNIGAFAGGLLGVIVAKQMSNSKAAIPIGLALGGALGAAIGKDVAKRQCEVFKVAQKNNLQFLSTQLKLPASGNGNNDKGEQVVGLSATLIDNGGNIGHFLPGSDQLTPQAAAYFREIAASYSPESRAAGLSQQERTAMGGGKILIVGHTDDHEDSATAADLSERRARAVATVFRSAGVPEASLYYQGAGETLPIANNNIEPEKNRRVEIIDVANDDVLAAYLKARTAPNTYFRPTPISNEAPTQVSQAPDKAATAVVRRPAPAVAAATKPPAKRSTNAPAARPQALAAAPPGNTPPNEAVARTSPAVAPATARLDIGGRPFNAVNDRVDIGEPLQSVGFSAFSVAVASDVAAGSCVSDRPRISRSVKSLRDASEYKVGDYRPGAYGASWVGTVNGHLLALNNVAVVRAGGLPAANPTVLMYRNFDPRGGASRKPDYSATPLVNSYSGSKGLLYRVFFDKGAPLRCIDVVLPASAPFKAEQGYVYQDRQDHTFSTEFHPEVPARNM